MRNMVKFGFIAIVFSFISCSDFPAAPEFEFCKFELDGEPKCESIHRFPKSDCTKVGGEIVSTCED